jgi:hypothetical protein
MWWNRRKETDPSKEDAELRALANSYAELYRKDPPKSSSMSSKTPSTSSPEPDVPSALPLSLDSVPELPTDDVIRGSSITYTRREAKLYAKEEPCDWWRHFDVPSP